MNAKNHDFFEHLTHDQPARESDIIESNPFALNEEAAETAIAELDRHVSSLFVLFHQYQKHHWLVEGSNFRDLHLFFEQCYKEIHADADLLAERLTSLGGIPASSPLTQTDLSYLDHEPEGYFPLESMLVRDLISEQKMITCLRETVKLANEHSDFTTADQVKRVLSHAEDRAHHLDHYLSDENPC